MVGTLNGKVDQTHRGCCTLTTYTVVTLPDAIQTISHEGIGAFRYSQSLLMTKYWELNGKLHNKTKSFISPLVLTVLTKVILVAVWSGSGNLPNQHDWIQEGLVWLSFPKSVGLKSSFCCCTEASVLSLSTQQSNPWKKQIPFTSTGTQNKTICLSYNMQDFPKTAYFSSRKCNLHRLNFRIHLQDSWEKLASL